MEYGDIFNWTNNTDSAFFYDKDDVLVALIVKGFQRLLAWLYFLLLVVVGIQGREKRKGN